MNIDCKNIGLSEKDEGEIKRLIEAKNPHHNDLEQMWFIMDMVWDEINCNNKEINQSMLEKFYSHPVWILNGLFIEQHELSMKHRYAISQWIVNKQLKSVIDYGGGFGTIAKLINKNAPNIKVDIFEPHPSDFSINRFHGIDNVHFISEIYEQYDCLIATDVLEHVQNPIELFYRMINCVKPNGYLLIQNNFFPVIKCHMPNTFHLRYSFDIIAKKMGLQNCGLLEWSCATIYKKGDCELSINKKIFCIELGSKLLFPLIKTVHHSLSWLKKKVV